MTWREPEQQYGRNQPDEIAPPRCPAREEVNDQEGQIQQEADLEGTLEPDIMNASARIRCDISSFVHLTENGFGSLERAKRGESASHADIDEVLNKPWS
jgi:hypothetical protein